MKVLRKLAPPILRRFNALKEQQSRRLVLRKLPEHSVGAEIGVWKGEFSEQILRVVQPSKLHLIDPWIHQPSPDFSQAWYGGIIGSQQNMDQIYQSVLSKFQLQNGVVEIHRGASEKVVAIFPDNYFDWIYVDGDHRFEAVLRDLELYLPKLKAEGIVAGDDYHREGAWWGDGVSRAVNDVVRRGLYRIVIIRRSQFMLRRANVAGIPKV